MTCKVGILYICCGRYNVFWPGFYESAEKLLLNDCDKHYFVYTDAIDDERFKHPNVTVIPQKNLGYPDSTLKRFEMFVRDETKFEGMDYLLFFNSNLVIKKRITRTDLGLIDGTNLVATLHPGYVNKNNQKFPYERSINSKAYIAPGDGTSYFAGGLQGGTTQAYLNAAKEISANINQDLSEGVIAIWHDESHWNTYLKEQEAVHALGPEYLQPEGWALPKVAKILIKNKDVWYGNAYLRRGGVINSKSKVLLKFVLLYAIQMPLRMVLKRIK